MIRYPTMPASHRTTSKSATYSARGRPLAFVIQALDYCEKTRSRVNASLGATSLATIMQIGRMRYGVTLGARSRDRGRVAGPPRQTAPFCRSTTKPQHRPCVAANLAASARLHEPRPNDRQLIECARHPNPAPTNWPATLTIIRKKWVGRPTGEQLTIAYTNERGHVARD